MVGTVADHGPDRGQIRKTAIRKSIKKEDTAAAKRAGLRRGRNVQVYDNVLEKKNRSRSRDEKKKEKKSKKKHYKESDSD